jgi:predicted esterase
VLQAASIVGFSPAFIAAFHEPTNFKIPNFFVSSAQHDSVSEILMMSSIREFRRLSWKLTQSSTFTNQPSQNV